MKKIYLLIVTICFSAISWAANPIPNILATDLRYVPHPYLDSYYFSFYVNTKPAKAIFRFYKSYDKMKQSINVVHHDLYNGTNTHTPDFIYEVPADKLHQGKIEVEFKMAGGKIVSGKITEPILPPGEWYWSVYVEAPRRSTEFGVMYTQPMNGDHIHYRMFAAVNTYPETDHFGHIYATDYQNNNQCRLFVYGIGDANINDENQVASNSRFSIRQKLIVNQMVNPRRPAVAPDGKVYLSDYGNQLSTVTTLGPAGFDKGGIWVFDPAITQNQAISGAGSISRFHEGNETSSGLSFYGSGASTKLYKTNTYGEITVHGDYNSNPKWLENGYRIFSIGNADGTLTHKKSLTEGTQVSIQTQSKGYGTTLKTVGGDANGHISIKVTDDGVWLCQHRSGTAHANPSVTNPNPDNFEATALMFQNHSGKRAFSSDVAMVDGKSLSQTETSIMQSTPGAGMTVSNNGKYLFVVNHQGNILQFEIKGTAAAAKSLSLVAEHKNTTTYHTISTLNFDYAGNLVASTDESYPSMITQIVVFTMPYPDRVNAQEIQAPNSCRFIPERLSQNNMEQKHIDNVVNPYISSSTTCTLDFFRPLQEGSFNSICLPFNINNLSGTPYEGAQVMKFDKARLEEVGGEQHLYFYFESVDKIEAGVPYLIQPAADVRGVVQFEDVQFTTNTSQTIPAGEYADFVGTFPQVNMDEPTTYPRLMVVSENRLAEIDGGTLLGFRSYFNTKKNLPVGTQSLLNFKKPTTTGTEMVVDGQTVNVEKFIREGRAYIRVGETLYTITGEVVGNRQ